VDLGLDGKCALVLAAGGGLGGAIARTLAHEGARVAAADLVESSAQATVERIQSDGGSAHAIAWDLANLERFPEYLEVVRNQVGTVDVLVNMTGGPPPTTASGVDIEVWSDQFRSMVLSVIHLSDLVLPEMRERRWGRIITSTTSGVIAPIPNLGISNTLRMSLLGWSKTLANEIGGEGITSNIVVPGSIATRRIQELNKSRAEREGRSVEEVERASTTSIPVGRYGEPEEYGAAVAFLASAAASYITGSVMRVDGGATTAV
jgi:3-oxoacyl-[acyl-carrier protein] reductase